MEKGNDSVIKKQEKYIQFPLFLLRELVIEKATTISKIFKYGIYRYSNKLEYNCTQEDVAKQIVFEIYRGKISNELYDLIDPLNSEYIGKDEDYNGFIGVNGFEPEDEIQELLKMFKDNPIIMELSLEHHRVHRALSSLNIEYKDIPYIIEVAKKIEKEKPEQEPMPMVNVNMLFNIRDTDKTEFELMQFAAYIAIRSIIGQRSYAKTNNTLILSRMLGYSSKKQIPQNLNPQIKELYEKYSKRYHMDKVLKVLENHWNVHIYSHRTRGRYIGLAHKISIKQLALEAEKRKEKNKTERLKQLKKDAREWALQQLSNATAGNKH